MESNKQNKMAVMSMPQLILNMSVPMMVSLLIQSLYNIVDSIFVAKISEGALTAISLAFPIQLLMIAVGVGTSVGVSAVISRSVGEKAVQKTGRIAATGILLALASAAVFTLLGLNCTGLYASAFTKRIIICDYCQQYLFICMVGCIGSFLATMYQRFLQAVGNTFDSMLSLIAGAAANLLLDPILIFGLCGFPALGIRGAAIATITGQCISAAFAILLNRIHNPVVTPIWKGYRLEASVLAKIYQVGLPTIVTQALGSIMVSSFNAILINFSSTAVAFFGIYYKLQSFLFMPMNGLGQALIPIVGFHYGAKNLPRIKQALRFAVPISAAIALGMSVVFLLFPAALLSLFAPSEALLLLGIPALRMIAPTFIFSAVSMILGYAVSGLGIGIVNMTATALRQFVVLIPLAYLLAKYCGISYVWYAIWIAELSAFVYAIWHTTIVLKKKSIL